MSPRILLAFLFLFLISSSLFSLDTSVSASNKKTARRKTTPSSSSSSSSSEASHSLPSPSLSSSKATAKNGKNGKPSPSGVASDGSAPIDIGQAIAALNQRHGEGVEAFRRGDYDTAARRYEGIIADLKEIGIVAASQGLLSAIARNADDDETDPTAIEGVIVPVEFQADLGVCYERSGLADEAESQYRRMVDVYPDSPLPSAYLCRFLQHVKSSKRDTRLEALPHCVRAVELDRNNSEYNQVLGILLVEMFEYERAKEFLAFAIKLNPADTLAMYNLAICLNRGGDSERAIEMATRLVEREPTAKNLAMLEVTLSTTQVHSREAVIARLQSNFFAVEEANVTDPRPERCPTGRRLVTNWLDTDSEPGVKFKTFVPTDTQQVYGTALRVVQKPDNRHVARRNPLQFNERKVFVMEMHDAFMEGRSGVIYNDCSVFAGLQRIQGEYFGGHRFNEDSGIPQFMLHAKPENASAILERFYVPFETVEVDVPVASLVSHNLANYYHWTTEALSRLAVFAKYLFVEDAYKDMKILVPRDVPWVEESFELFGIDKGRILWYDHTASTGAATGSQMRRYHFSKLFTVQWKQMNSQEQYMNDAWTIYYPPKTTLLWVRDIILSSPALAKWRESRSAASSSSSSVGSCVDGACAGSGSSAESPSTKPVDTDAKTRSASDQNKNSRKNILYVSRQDASVRKVDREEKLLDALRKKYGDDVIQVFVGKGKSMMEQIDMFSRADLVIGPHGAGLANMLFNPRGTTVVMFPLEPHVDHCFGHLAMALDHELWVVPEIHAFYYGNYAVDSGKIDEVKLIVSKIFEERKKIAAA